MVEGGVTANTTAPIQAPRIKSIASKDIKVFLSQRRTSEDAIGSMPGVNHVAYRSCFDDLYLEYRIGIEYIGEAVTKLEEVTDAVVKAKLEESVGVSVVQAHLRLAISESDSATGILILNAAYTTLSQKHGWIFKQNAPKAAILHLVSVLQLPVLKKKSMKQLNLTLMVSSTTRKSVLLF